MSPTALSPQPSTTASHESSGPKPPSFPFAKTGQQDALRHLSSVLTRHLSTLTSTISGYADLLTEARSREEQRTIAMNVMEASTRIDDLLADLRYYSRPLEPAMRTVSVKEVVKSAIDLLEREDRGQVCSKIEPSAARDIEADPQLLRQALLNLLQNAVEATDPTDDILLRATGAEDHQHEEPRITFEVWNDGEINLENPSSVFAPFFSAHPQRLGLGLPIAVHVAECHGGTLELTTNCVDDGGTCFSLTV